MKIKRWFRQRVAERYDYHEGLLIKHEGKLVWAWTGKYSSDEPWSYIWIDENKRKWKWLLDHSYLGNPKNCHLQYFEGDI